MAEYLFLYGTLIAEKSNNEVTHLAKRLRRVGKAHVPGRLYDLGDYPGAVLDHSSNTLVKGELVSLPRDRELLEAFDRYEEFDSSNPSKSVLIRKKTRITLANGRMVDAWIYVYNRPISNAPLIRGGDYWKSKVA